MHNNDKDFRMFSLSLSFSYGDEKSGTCGPSFFSLFSFSSDRSSAKDRGTITYIIVILASANNYSDLFATRRRQIRGRCRCRTAAAGSAQGAMRLDVEEGAIG